MKHFVFVTYELQPVTSGGAGVFIAGAARTLARAGHHVTVLVDLPEREVVQARRHARIDGLVPGRIDIEAVSGLARWVPEDKSVFRRNSERFRLALAELDARRPIDLVEFPEYAGMGLASLRAHALENWLPRAKIAVRVHGSLEFIDRVEGSTPGEEQLDMYRMEHEGLRLADIVFIPSRSLGAQYASEYCIASDRVVVSPPPMEDLLAGIEPLPRLPDPGHFLFFGKLQEVKGCVQLAQAAVALIAEDPKQRWRFTFIGRDTFCARHGQPTSRCVSDVIPQSVRSQFEFLPSIDRSSLPRYCVRPTAAIFPSRFETFCLAAHEVRACGVPLIVPRIPAFTDLLHAATGCLTYDGTTAGLRGAMSLMRSDAELRTQLELAPRPTYSAFADAYEAPFPRDALRGATRLSAVVTRP